MPCSDQHHEQFKRASKCHGWPRADQRSYRPVDHAVRQVGSNRRHDADGKAPARQPWYTLAPPARVQHHHGCGQDEAVYHERCQASRRAGLAVRLHQFVGVLVGDNRGDAATATTASAVVILSS